MSTEQRNGGKKRKRKRDDITLNNLRTAPKASNKISPYDYKLKKLKLTVFAKPNHIEMVERFEDIKVHQTLLDKMQLIIQQIKTHDKEEHFFHRVLLSGYSDIVLNPIHFGQILKRMNKNKYKTLGEIKCDIDLLWTNCYHFNGKPNPNDPVTAGFSNFAAELEWVLNEYIREFVEELMSKGWINPNSTIPSLSSHNFLVPLDLEVPRKPFGMVTVDRLDRVRAVPLLTEKIELIIKQIKTHDREQHFFKKVPHPDYLDYISNPIHFGKILKRINKHKYETLGDIQSDIDLLWRNCFTFNGEPDASNPGFFGFSNFAANLQWILNEYMKKFKVVLQEKGYIKPNVSGNKRKRGTEHDITPKWKRQRIA
eukprot:183497_1